VKLAGKAAIVTGAGSGIGRATATLFAREGARVVVADINLQGALETVEAIKATGGSATCVKVDVSLPQEVEEMVQRCLLEYGALDILHNNAYWAPVSRPLVETTEYEWDRTIDVTLKGVFLGCKYAIPEMIGRGGGVIINTASTAGLTTSPAFAAYMAAKGGVVQITKSVALDYGSKGIRCNAIAPGIIETPATKEQLDDPQMHRQMLSRCLVGRIGQPDDIARAALYLASDDSSFITGHVLVVDGGRLAT